jgi:large subunit ribosomal protein L25
MTEKVNLAATKRDVFGRKTNKGRKEGLIPAVVYGRGIKSESLWVKYLDFSRLIDKSGESTMISLEIDGKNDRNVILYEIQKDPVKDNYTHIDFFQVRMDEEIETEVELIFANEENAPAVKELGGVLVKNMDKVTVKCLPGDLPSEIEVNVAILKTFEDRIIISDLNISDKVKIDLEPETVVALVSPPRSEEELSQLEEKVEEDVTKVEGVVKEQPDEAPAEGQEEKKEEAKKE